MDEDFALLQRWREGDNEAGGELFACHFDRLLRFFFNKVGGSEAEDLIQRTLLACVKSRDAFRGQARFRTYLFAIARNEMLAHFRRQRSRPDLDFAESSMADLRTSGCEVVARAHHKALLLDALQRLPVDTQLLVELHYWEELAPGDLAHVFDIDPTTVRTRLHRARARLRAIIDELEKDPSLRERALGGLDTWARNLHQDDANAPGRRGS